MIEAIIATLPLETIDLFVVASFLFSSPFFTGTSLLNLFQSSIDSILIYYIILMQFKFVFLFLKQTFQKLTKA